MYTSHVRHLERLKIVQLHPDDGVWNTSTNSSQDSRKELQSQNLSMNTNYSVVIFGRD